MKLVVGKNLFYFTELYNYIYQENVLEVSEKLKFKDRT